MAGEMSGGSVDILVSTGFRFHPVEIIFSLMIKMAAIVVIGAHPFSVIIFEMILASTSEFNHGNVYLPPKFERYLRWILVTPDMHRIHHSAFFKETDSNYGFSVSWWDRLFRTYTSQPKTPQTKMTLGLNNFRDDKKLSLGHLLVLPFQPKLSRDERLSLKDQGKQGISVD